MPKHKVGTQEEWVGKVDEELAKQRMELPWVPVEKEYVFDTEGGKKTLAELFDGRSQLDQIPDGRDADFPLRRHDEY